MQVTEVKQERDDMAASSLGGLSPGARREAEGGRAADFEHVIVLTKMDKRESKDVKAVVKAGRFGFYVYGFGCCQSRWVCGEPPRGGGSGSARRLAG